MIPALVVFIYLGLVLYIGVFAFRKGKSTGEDYFLASRSLGPLVFLLALFGANMTAFSILGASGLAYHRGIGIFGLLASSSALVIPLSLFFIGTRLWALGKRFGHMTQVQFFRDRWECGFIGTVIFAVTALMLIPYVIIGIMGGGQTLEALSGGKVPYSVGGAVVATVIMTYVFFGGMRGTAWVNTFQSFMFLGLGTAAFVLIGRELGGFSTAIQQLAEKPDTLTLLTRHRISPQEFFSYTFIPLSSIMFPHVAIMCMTAEKVSSFRKTVIFYPICILLLWLPSVFLGVIAAHQFPGLKPGESDDVILRLLLAHTPPLLAGLLGAAIMAAVMAADSQILALCTMFTEDVFAYYGGKNRFAERTQVWIGRLFVLAIAFAAYWIALALKDKEGIFNLAIRFAFSGFSAMAPVMVAALFWKRSTKWGALAATLWVALTMAASWWLHQSSGPIAPKPGQPPVPIFPEWGALFLRGTGGVTHYGYLAVVPMTLGSAFLVWIVSLFTAPPSPTTVQKYFSKKTAPAQNALAAAPLS